VLARKYAKGPEFRGRGLFGLSAFRLNARPNDHLSILINGTPVTAPMNEQLADDYFDGDNLWWMDGETNFLAEDGAVFAATIPEPRGSVGGHGVADGVITAPMPGKVTAVEVSQGETVTKGQRLLTLEAMKMEHGLTAPFDGKVTELSAQAGAQVGEGAVLARVEPKEEE
jgi:3-methylcrotonyl-CoA carboxylase alpha subunit